MKHLAAVLILAVCGFAADCPVTFNGVDFWDLTHNQSGINERSIHMKLHNESNKTISAVKAAAIYYNAVKEPFPVTDSGATQTNIKPGKGKTLLLHEPFLLTSSQEQYYSLTAYIEKLVFDDGTTWEDNGSHVCSGEWLKHPRK
jgi:hypothetical protein